MKYKIKTIQGNTIEINQDVKIIYGIKDEKVFYIDPGCLPPQKAEDYLHKIVSKYNNNSQFKDYFILKRSGNSDPYVETTDFKNNIIFINNKDKMIFAIEKDKVDYIIGE